MRRALRLCAAVAGVLVLAVGCGSGATADRAADGGGAGGTETVRIFAAASLQQPFEELGERFEAEHEGVELEFNFAGSSTLVEQIRQGAPADVFASADEATMDALVDAGLQEAPPVEFTTNTLMIAVPAGNPAGVTDLASLEAEGLHLVVCARAVPCGAATAEVEEAAGLELAPVSEEQSVTDVLNKVTTGEADAGLVYTTDVRSAGEAVEGIAFPEAQDAVNVYPITTVAGAGRTDLGAQFVDLVTGEQGQQVLAAHGFGGR